MVDAQNQAQMQAVKVDLTQGTTIVVASGLKAGERVVTDGGTALEDGMKVRTK